MMSFPKSWYTAFSIFHFSYSKLDKVKTMGTHEKLNAIWWNVKINLRKILIDVCGYKLPTNLQTFMQKDLNIPKSFRGATFLKHPVLCHSWKPKRRWNSIPDPRCGAGEASVAETRGRAVVLCDKIMCLYVQAQRAAYSSLTFARCGCSLLIYRIFIPVIS